MDVPGLMTREDSNEFVKALTEIVQDKGIPVGIDIEVNGLVIGCIQNGRKRYHFSAVTEWREG